MTTPNDDSLTLADVRERFTASASVLDDVRFKLQRIVESEARRDAAALSLEASASAAREFLTAATSGAEQLAEAQRTATALLAAAQSIIDGTELSSIRQVVERIDESQTAIDSAVATTNDGVRELGHSQDARLAASATTLESLQRSQLETNERLLALEGRVADTDELRGQLLELQTRYERLKAVAPGRAVRRAEQPASE